MMNRKGFSALEFLFIFCIVGVIIGVSFWYFDHHQTIPTQHKTVAQQTVITTLATIANSGSTNFAGWTITINSDGSGKLVCNTTTLKHSSCVNNTYPPGAFPIASFQRDLADTNLSGYSNDCTYSASFGSVDTLTYDGKNTVGIDCYASTEKTPLANDITIILHKINVQ